MAAFVETEFRRSFFLSEESLIRIDDIVRRRVLSAIPDGRVTYSVYRKDDMFLEYSTVADVVSEENSARNFIKELVVRVNHDDLKFELQFAKKGLGPILRMEATDRDLAFLLSSDVKEYLRSEVLRFYRISFDEILVSVSFTMVFTVVAFAALIGSDASFSKQSPDMLAAIKSNDLSEKIDYLISRSSSRRERIGPLLAVLIASSVGIGLALYGSLQWARKYQDVFYWGKEVTRYDRYKAVKDKLFWGVGIALVVGVLATFIFERIAK